MKKILLFLGICVLTGLSYQSYAQQICGSGLISRWTGTNQPGDHFGITTAPITIDGNAGDWVTNITGPFSYFNQPVPTFQPDPHTAPVAAANVQLDDLKGTTDEFDRPGQNHRDLRYFAFTYDVKNVYFYFRRPANNSAQVAFYYFVDINVDGFMRTGEPVIKITYNGGAASMEMNYYVENAGSNATAAGSYVAGKGNAMSATVNRTGTNSISDWEVGSADGWSMFGSVATATGLPALAAGEIFNAVGLTDTYSDGATSTGYGAEFAVPWNYLRLYGGASYAGYNPLTFNSIFTWHVSLENGANSNSSDDEDNAGGCCSGVAVSGTPDVGRSATWEKTSGNAYDYRLNITYTNAKAYPTVVTTANIVIVDPKDANGQPIPENVIKNWSFVGYKNADCIFGNETTSDSAHFIYSNTSGTTYTFQAFNSSKTNVTAAGSVGSTTCYYINVNAFGWPPLASATVQWNFTTAFDISSSNCNNITGGGSAGSLEVLPVKFLSFVAVRNGSNVNLTWQTATEEGNTGFEVQKFMGSGDWQTITFVPTQAVNGYSNSPLSYSLNDINTSRGITQYRLKQIDKNNRSSYSVIRSVRGEGQKGKTIVYPNPSSDGKVNIIFEDAKGIRDITVTDMSGRMIKQMKGVTNNNIQIDNLNAGMYTVRVQNLETGEQVVEKFVVNKR